MNTNHRSHHSAFTLLELLVVISIIALLISLLIGAGVAITRNAKLNQTKGVLTALDRALEEFMMANNGNIPLFDRRDFAGVPGRDGPNGKDSPTATPDPAAYLTNPRSPMPQRPDASVFVRRARGVGDVDAIIGGIPERFLVVTVMSQSTVITSDPILEANERDTSPSFLDAWANDQWPSLIQVGDDDAWPIQKQSLIYYVHPGNRRNRTDTSLDVFPDAQELYGETVNGRPYFMSAGPDGFYGHPSKLREIANFYDMKAITFEEKNRVLLQARKDNLYSTPVNINFKIREGVINELTTQSPTP